MPILIVVTPQMTLTCVRSKIPMWILHAPINPKCLSVLLCEQFSSYVTILRQMHHITLKWPGHVWGHKCPCGFHVHQPYLSIYCLLISGFWVTSQFWSVANDTKMTLTCSRSNVPICVEHKPRHPKFCFKFWAYFETSALNAPQMTLTYSRSCIPICMHSTYRPGVLIFISFIQQELVFKWFWDKTTYKLELPSL